MSLALDATWSNPTHEEHGTGTLRSEREGSLAEITEKIATKKDGLSVKGDDGEVEPY